MPTVLNLPICLALAAAVMPQCSGSEPAKTPGITISVEQPAYVGQPLWVRITSGPSENVRYPFSTAVEDTGCNLLELKRDGELLAPRPIKLNANMGGILCGSVAPPGSPEHRLPLHVLYPLDRPGTYSVRWTIRSYRGPGQSDIVTSDWLTFSVTETTPREHEQWLTRMLASAPSDDGHLAGDYLPSLLAAAPDPRVTSVFIRYLYYQSVVAGIASSCLERLPEPEVKRAVVTAVERYGPSDALAYLATYHTGWTLDDEQKVVRASISYLDVANLPPVSEGTGNSALGTKTTAAIKLLRFVLYIPNQAWPLNQELATLADERVLQAAPTLISQADDRTVQELAEYLGSMRTSVSSHELLIKIAQQRENVGMQARIGLMAHPQPTDLPFQSAALTAPGDSDTRGSDRSVLPYSLVAAFGDAALPSLEIAVLKSPYVWVRVQSAEQLALRNRPIGFKFLLNALEADQPYKAEVLRWVRDAFASVVQKDATEQEIATFLRVRSEAPPSSVH